MHAWFRHWQLTRKRQAALRIARDPAVRQYLQSPLPAYSLDVAELNYLVVDLEMSGLHADTDQILSMGYVPVRKQQIILKEACHELIRQPDLSLDATAPIHNIRHTDLETGQPLEDALERLLSALSGHVLVVHHAPLDTAFLQRSLSKHYQLKLLSPVVDTLKVEQTRYAQRELPAGGLRLHACRDRYNLPPALAHNALTDAIATAELWLAQMSSIRQGKAVSLSYFL